MKGVVIRSLVAALVLGTIIFGVSCARNHDLVAITVTPNQETLGIACTTPGVATTCAPTTVYRAIGHYIHPQTDRDITSEVTWTTSNPDLISFADPNQPNVMFPTGTGCGTNLLVQATLNADPGNVKIGTASVTINCGGSGAGSGGPQTDFTLTPNTASQTVAPGGTATFIIEVNVVSDTPTVQLQVNQINLPPEISSFTLSPNSVTAPGQATLTLTASKSAVHGSAASVQILGNDGSGGANTTVTLNIS